MQSNESIPIAVWSPARADEAPEHLPGLKVSRLCGLKDLALVSGSFEAVIAARKAAGQQPYIARIDGEPVAYAWVARGLAHIGEVGVSFNVPDGSRFLCEFVPLDARGLEAAPQVLIAIARREGPGRLWAPARCHKAPSSLDLERAGFETAAFVSFSPDEGARLQAAGSPELLSAASELLGLAPAPKKRVRAA